MSDTYANRLKWEKPAYPVGVSAPPSSIIGDGDFVDEGGGAANAAFAATGVQPRAATMMEKMLWTVGVPTGSTPEARSSPVLEARDLLRAAAEIEHGLLVQYLYGAYTCTNPVHRSVLLQIAREEMAHLISVQNLLLAIGGHPYFGRDNFPTAPSDDETFPFALTFEPLSLDFLAKFVVAESPPLEYIKDKGLKGRVQPVIRLGEKAAHQTINHVGALYVALYWLFKTDDSKPAEWLGYPLAMVQSVHRKLERNNWHVPNEAFVSKEELEDRQASNDNPGENWNKGDDRLIVHPVMFSATGEADRAAVLNTLFKIAEQGEGWNASTSEDPDAKSHFIRLLETFESVQALPAGSLIALDVPTNPTAFVPTADGFIANKEANLWAQIFNARYRIALLKLNLALASPRSLDLGTVDGRGQLISDAIATEMKSNLRNIALALIKMRRSGVPADGVATKRAAPPFELPTGSLPNLVDLDPDPKIAEIRAIKLLRRVLRDALDDTADLVNRLHALPPEEIESQDRLVILDDIVAADVALRTALA